MNPRQRQAVLASMGLAIAAWLAAPWLGSPRSGPEVSQDPLLFDGGRALDAAREFVTQYPRRTLGSLEARQSTAFFRRRLQPLGFEISYAHFEATIAGRTQVGRNVLALKRGRDPQLLALLAHYDTADTTVQGAMDNGSGIGAFIELARALTASPLRRSLLLAATDGEEWGMLGAMDLAANYEERQDIIAALSLDYVAAGDLANLQLAVTGQMSGYAPGWLRALCHAAAAEEGLPVLEPYGLLEHIERAILLSWTDQGPLIARGVPAINLGSGSADEALEARIYHTSADTIEKLRPGSLQRFGRAAERILRTLDTGAPDTKDLTAPFLIARGRQVSATAVLALQALTFLPLMIGAMFGLARARLSLRAALRELVALLAIFLPLLVLYGAIVILTMGGRVPSYSIYPPAPGHPTLANPDAGVLLSLAAAFLIAAAACFLGARSLMRKLSFAGFDAARELNLIALAAITLAALRYNSYWAATFLGLPAWCWVIAGQGRGAAARWGNSLLIVAAGAPWYAFTAYNASLLGVGWKMVWYEVLALGNGMFRPGAFFLSAAAVSIGLRLLTLQFLRAGAEASVLPSRYQGPSGDA